jgi:hypothetical protein
MHLIINLTIESGIGFGELCNHVVMNYEKLDWITLTLDGSIPDYVDIYDFTWEWKIYAITNESGYCSAESTNYTDHTYYTLLSTPQEPMAEPWTSVLEKACDWAAYQPDPAESVSAITDALYNSGFNYDVAGGGDSYYGSWTEFELSDFISDIGSSNPVNCLDMAKAVTTFGNAIGCGLGLATYGYTDFKDDNPIDGPLNCIDPIGMPGPTNNPFSSPAIADDCRESGFGYHAFAELTSNNKVFDATLQYDIDPDPDNVVNSNPEYCGDTTSGHSWILPANEAEGTYISRLIDPWPKWYQQTPTLRRNRSFSVFNFN